MDQNREVKVSKTLSYVLRHRPDGIGIEPDAQGWTPVESLLQALQAAGKHTTRDELAYVVENNPKQRFEFDATGKRIRARQGHSVDVELGYTASVPPDVLFHGTATRFLESIFAEGLTRRRRHHVHLGTDTKLMLEVASRHGRPALLRIDAAQMLADGHAFFVTANDVWLTEHVPPRYIEHVQAQ